MRLEFPHIFFYEASAGSGKTRRLAEHYIGLLLNYSTKDPTPFRFQNVLAITFTNEAADQMRQEILNILKSKALAHNKDSHRASGIVDEIIHKFSDFSIRTIDSFVHSLLVASSLELKLPPDYEIMPHSQASLEYVLDVFLDEIPYNQEIRELFLEFLNHFLIVEGQIQWQPKKILLELLSSFYREENGRAKPFLLIPEELDLKVEENALKKKLDQFLLSLDKFSDINQRFTKSLRPLLDRSGIHFLKGFNNHLNKTLSPGEGIFNKQAETPTAELKQDWDSLKGQYKNYAHEYVWLRYNSYLKIFSQFRQRLEDFKQTKRIVFLDELNKKARHFLTSEGLLPAEIYYKLSSVLYHYLIDEFQDTSLLQWENIQSLIEDALSKGGSLFYVGDKKQAIYRFRGGEVELFDSVKSRFKNQVSKVYNRLLPYNYRSSGAIVKFNNQVFSQRGLSLFLDNFKDLEKESQDRILSVFKDSQQKQAALCSDSGYLRIELLEGKNKEKLEECLNKKLKQTLLELNKRFSNRDILLLVRDNQEAEGLANFLLEEGFSVCASRTVSIRQNYLIRQIIALLKFLHSPIDNLSFANFILGDIFSSATKSQSCLMQSWIEGARLNKDAGVLYTQFRLRFADIWQKFIQDLFNAAGYLPAYDLVESILSSLRLRKIFQTL